MVSAGEIPDVMEMPDTWLSLYANNGLLESLEPYLAKWEHTAGLTDRALELGRDVNKTAYMLPYGFYLRAMFYNKKLFQEAGVAEPPKTMDEFVTASEKVAKLPRPLTMDGVPPGADPEINDLGYYAPSGDLVFYYGDVGYFNGIVRIGRLSGQDMDLIERQPDGREITIERG